MTVRTESPTFPNLFVASIFWTADAHFPAAALTSTAFVIILLAKLHSMMLAVSVKIIFGRT